MPAGADARSSPRGSIETARRCSHEPRTSDCVESPRSRSVPSGLVARTRSGASKPLSDERPISCDRADLPGRCSDLRRTLARNMVDDPGLMTDHGPG